MGFVDSANTPLSPFKPTQCSTHLLTFITERVQMHGTRRIVGLSTSRLPRFRPGELGVVTGRIRWDPGSLPCEVGRVKRRNLVEQVATVVSR